MYYGECHVLGGITDSAMYGMNVDCERYLLVPMAPHGASH